MHVAILFVPGLSIILGIYGYLAKSALPLPEDGETEPTVEVFIPALNEVETIAYAIASLARQSYRPEKVTIVDDGSTDATAEVVEAMRDRADLDLEMDFVRHADPGSKTKRLKQVTRNSTADKIFVLDADTYLVSETYLERVVAAHDAEDVACSFGVVRPDSRSAKRSFHRRELGPTLPDERVVTEAAPEWIDGDRPWTDRASYLLTRWPVEQYRSVLYAIEQQFFKESQMRLIKTSLFPAGCGVLYDQSALRTVFDDYEASLGDQLTNSEDIFIGFSLVDRGFANVQVSDVTMRTVEPSLGTISNQMYLWSSSFLQSSFYFRSFSEHLRSWTGDVTDTIVRNEVIDSISAETTTVGTDGGTTEPDSLGSAERTPTEEESDEAVSEPERRSDSDDQPSPVDVSSSDDSNEETASEGVTTGDRGTDDLSDGSRRIGRRRTLSAVVTSQLIDGLYPTALLIVGLLAIVGLVPIELVVAVVAVEFGLYCLVAVLFARRQITILSLLVSIPVRLCQLPIGVYVYAQVATDLLVGKRNWNK